MPDPILSKLQCNVSNNFLQQFMFTFIFNPNIYEEYTYIVVSILSQSTIYLNPTIQKKRDVILVNSVVRIIIFKLNFNS